MKIIDLTKTIYDGMPVYPGDPEVVIEQTHDFTNHDYLLKKITMGTHTGTHVDGFNHMDKKGLALDEMGVENFVNYAVKIQKTDDFPFKKGLVFDEIVDVNLFDKIIKAKAPFVAGEITYALEKKLLQHQVITYTNLINLEKLPYDTSFLFIGLPLKIKAGDGSPVRAIAILDI